MKTINFIDQNTAAALKACGFSYAEVKMGERVVYQFILTDQLERSVRQHFAQDAYFLQDHACFGMVVKQ